MKKNVEDFWNSDLINFFKSEKYKDGIIGWDNGIFQLSLILNNDGSCSGGINAYGNNFGFHFNIGKLSNIENWPCNYSFPNVQKYSISTFRELYELLVRIKRNTNKTIGEWLSTKDVDFFPFRPDSYYNSDALKIIVYYYGDKKNPVGKLKLFIKKETGEISCYLSKRTNMDEELVYFYNPEEPFINIQAFFIDWLGGMEKRNGLS